MLLTSHQILQSTRLHGLISCISPACCTFSCFPSTPVLPAHPYPHVLRYSQCLCSTPWASLALHPQTGSVQSPSLWWLILLPCIFPAVPASLVTVWAQSPLAAELWSQRGWSNATLMQQVVEAVLLPFLLVLPALSQARYGFGRGARWAGSLVPPWGCKCPCHAVRAVTAVLSALCGGSHAGACVV